MYKILLILLISVTAFAQVQFTVETDTSAYQPGATIGISGTITNISGETVTLNWPTGCQFNYYLGAWAAYDSPNYGCTLAHTWVTLEPAMSHTWERFHGSEDTTFEAGNYAIVGFLNDEVFRLTPPTFITIGDVQEAYYTTGYAPPTDSLLLTNGGCVGQSLLPVLEQVTDDLDLIWIYAYESCWYQYIPVNSMAINPYPWEGDEFYFYVRDSLDYDYELHLITDVEDQVLSFDEINHSGADGDCVYRLIITHENVVVDTLEYAFKAEMSMGVKSGQITPALFNVEAYPSPFNPLTTISFELLERSDVDVNIFDLSGRLVWSTSLKAPDPGRHELKWNGQDTWGGGMASGLYIVQIDAGRVSESTKVVMLK